MRGSAEPYRASGRVRTGRGEATSAAQLPRLRHRRRREQPRVLDDLDVPALYYTDVVGLAAAAVGTLFLVVRFFDAFADLFAGRLVDRTPPGGASSGRSSSSARCRCC